jgi:S1-C subfamily serine protease
MPLATYVNDAPVTSVANLRAALDGMKPRSPVVLQIERNGRFRFLGFELDNQSSLEL